MTSYDFGGIAILVPVPAFLFSGVIPNAACESANCRVVPKRGEISATLAAFSRAF